MPSAADIFYKTFKKKIPASLLNEKFGNPDTIVCVGNGPSAGGKNLLSIEHDCLFRVNPCSCNWLNTGYLNNPDAVFMSSAPENFVTIRKAIHEGKIDPPIIFMRGRKAVKRARRYGLSKVYDCNHINFWNNTENVHLYSHVRGKRYIPTNGVMMLAVASALQPPRLVVAGIDFYNHHAGDYSTSNKAIVLEIWKELGTHALIQEIYTCIRALKQEYRGELIVIGDVLNKLINHPGIDRILNIETLKQSCARKLFDPGDSLYIILKKLDSI